MHHWLISLCALALLGCGYRPVRGSIPGGGQAVHVETVTSRVPFAGLSTELTRELRSRLAMAGLEVSAKDRATVFLDVSIESARGETGMLRVDNSGVFPLDELLELCASARLSGSGIPKDRSSLLICARGRASTGSSAVTASAIAELRRLELTRELADRIIETLFE